MTDQTKAPERIWTEADENPYYYEESDLNEAASPVTEYLRADIAAEQVREAYERGLEDALAAVDKVDVVEPCGGSAINDALRSIRVLKSDDASDAHGSAVSSECDTPSPGQAVSSVAPAAWRDVIAERHRQIEVEGWTSENDDAHQAGELAEAAAAPRASCGASERRE